MATSWIRLVSGVPTEANFGNTQGGGSPLVIDVLTGLAYVWNGGLVTVGGGGGGGGVTVHADLTGLSADDHPQYLLVTDAVADYAAIDHSHPDATALVAGFLSPAGFSKLAGIAPGATAVLTGTFTVTIPHMSWDYIGTVAIPGLTAAQEVSVTVGAHSDLEENSGDLLGLLGLNAVPSTDLLTLSLTFSEPTSGPIRFNYFAG